MPVEFQSTPSAWRETDFHSSGSRTGRHFNPLPPHGGRLSFVTNPFLLAEFQSTPSAWRETCGFITQHPVHIFISIHSLRMEGDRRRQRKMLLQLYFNPLPPHGGRPLLVHINGVLFVISIHSLRMEGDVTIPDTITSIGISIHSLRMEGDMDRAGSYGRLPAFQSTPSAWRETLAQKAIDQLYNISIHSLRMEGDFSSNTSVYNNLISIHSLRMEGDAAGQDGTVCAGHFNPLPPHGGRHQTGPVAACN